MRFEKHLKQIWRPIAASLFRRDVRPLRREPEEDQICQKSETHC
jgi:hypothetical protein